MIGISPYPQPHAPQIRPVSPVVVYGRRWCALSQMVRRYLDRAGIPYDYVDLDTNPNAQAQLTWMTGGRVHSPIVSVGGQLLVQPSIAELQWVLARM
jgi:mycoredoxin